MQKETVTETVTETYEEYKAGIKKRPPADTLEVRYRCCLPALAGFTVLSHQRSA